jgi:hypothetical protein
MLQLVHDEQNISLSSTLKGYFPALSFAVKFGGRYDFVFSVEETAGDSLQIQGTFVSYCRRNNREQLFEDAY